MIVIAWIVRSMAPNGKPFRGDLGELPKLVARVTPHAAMWATHPSEEERANAMVYVARLAAEGTECATMFTYEESESDPLHPARRDIIALATKTLPS